MATLFEVAATSTAYDAPAVKYSTTIIMEGARQYTAIFYTLCITYWNWGIICAQAYRSPGCNIHSEAYR